MIAHRDELDFVFICENQTFSMWTVWMVVILRKVLAC
jgi:hypothetical protein